MGLQLIGVQINARKAIDCSDMIATLVSQCCVHMVSKNIVFIAQTQKPGEIN